MACKTVCKICKNLVISTAVAFSGGNLVITLPDGSYQDGQKKCIVVAQTIPDTTTINAPVFIQIGTGTELYPLQRCDCAQATACQIRTRTKYATKVVTNPTSGSFRLLGKVGCAPNNNLAAINGSPVTVTTTEGGN